MGGYFDHNATTPVDPRVREAMLPWLGERWGNPSSVHAWGRAAQEAVEGARQAVAELIGAAPPEVVFTASGTEANNAVMLSAGRAAGFDGHVVLSALEHPSVDAAATLLGELGMAVTRVPPEIDGRVDPGRMLAALRPDTRLACLMLANNELGTLQPVAEVAAGCRERGVPVLCDAVQAVGKMPVEVGELEVDFLSLGAHKLNGPLGAAALWVRPGARFEPLLVGGGQERRRRASTPDVPALVGLGRAAELAVAEGETRAAASRALRDRFEAAVRELPGAIVHCAAAPRLPNTSHVAFSGVDAEALMIRLDLAGWAVSTGAACSSGAVEPSRVLRALGLPAEEALASLRVSFGAANTAEQVDEFLDVLAAELAELCRLAAPAVAG